MFNTCILFHLVHIIFRTQWFWGHSLLYSRIIEERFCVPYMLYIYNWLNMYKKLTVLECLYHMTEIFSLKKIVVYPVDLSVWNYEIRFYFWAVLHYRNKMGWYEGDSYGPGCEPLVVVCWEHGSELSASTVLGNTWVAETCHEALGLMEFILRRIPYCVGMQYYARIGHFWARMRLHGSWP
jgi:hypothetical protein